MCNENKRKVQEAKVASNQEICKDHFLIEIESSFLGEVSRPGQFVNVKAENGEKVSPLLRIPLGVHAVTKNGIELLYKKVGPKTEMLSEKKKGDMISILGPLGNGFDQTLISEKKDPKAILVAGGHGVAPLYALAETFIKNDIETEFFLGAKTAEQLTCVDKLKGLGIDPHLATDDGSEGKKGYVPLLVQKHLKDQKFGNNIIYACGPRPMLSALAEVARELDITAQVSLDAYMACGIGACQGCAVMTVDGYKMVCKDGPVFDAREIVWEEYK